MRIGFFLDSYKPYVSGVVHSVDSFSSELRRLGHEVFIVAPGAPGCVDEEYVVRAPSFHTPFQPDQHYLPYPHSPALRRQVEKLHLDIIHTHHMFLLGRLGAAWARRMGIPLVHTYHTLLTEYVHYVPVAPGAARRGVVCMTRRYCNRCDAVVVPTPQITPVLQSYGVTAPISVVPTGIDLARYGGLDKGDIRCQLGYTDDEFVLIWLSRMTREKNPEFVIEAFASLAHERPRARLLMAGGGALEGRIHQRVSELGLLDKVKLVGPVPYSDVPRYFTAADLFVFASVTETQAIVVPEAMAAGLPVVAVGANGVSGMVRDGQDGFLTALDTRAFTARIREVMDDSELYRSLVPEALRSAATFSSVASAMSLEGLYRGLASGRN